MEDIRSILNQFHSKKRSSGATEKTVSGPSDKASFSEIPDIFFDEILGKFKLSRQDITVLMALYRQIWCKPNLYRSHGIGPLNSYQELANSIHLNQEETLSSIRHLESYGLIETIRSGQYFVRKFFTEENDLKYGQDYDHFF
jgi:DNA-binding MarR family transcriptional regulator